MSAAVADLLSAAMKLPAESRTELVEAILEQTSLDAGFIAEQMAIVSQRMERVRQGVTQVIPAEAAHDAVLASLKLRA